MVMIPVLPTPESVANCFCDKPALSRVSFRTEASALAKRSEGWSATQRKYRLQYIAGMSVCGHAKLPRSPRPPGQAPTNQTQKPMKTIPNAPSSPQMPLRKARASRRKSTMRTLPALFSLLASLLFFVGGSRKADCAEDKPPVSQSIFTRSWPNGYCELQWKQDEIMHRILTNIDCSKLPLFLTFDSGEQKIELFTVASVVGAEEVTALKATGAVDGSGFPVEWPKQNRPAFDGSSQYLIGWDDSFSPEELQKATAWLDALHRYYDAHRLEISEAWRVRQSQQPVLEGLAKQREERLRQEAKTPPTRLRVISIERTNKGATIPVQIPTTEGSGK